MLLFSSMLIKNVIVHAVNVLNIYSKWTDFSGQINWVIDFDIVLYFNIITFRISISGWSFKSIVFFKHLIN